MLEITTLLDNINTEHKTVTAKHGLSMFIRTESLNIVFDCGPDATAVNNSRLLNAPIDKANYVILSHSHYDHSAGYPEFVRNNVKGVLYTGPNFFKPKYAYDGVKYTYLGAGFDEYFIAENNIIHKVCDGCIELSSDCYIFSGFPRRYEFETIPERFVHGSLPDTVKDDFGDEICIAADTSKGLVVLVACSHPGILNMLTHIHDVLKKPIYAVLGGTHLVEADENRIALTIDAMKKNGTSHYRFIALFWRKS